MPHENLPLERIVKPVEYLGDGVFPFSSLPEHIFLSRRVGKVDASNAGAFLAPIVLLLHH